MKHDVQLVIEARWVCPVVPDKQLLENHAVVINQGKIIDLCDIALALEKYEANEIVRLNDQLLIPGLINTHTHAAMSLMRGLADDLPLMPWLNDHIWPAEASLVSPDFVYDGSLLACAEMLSGGVTTFNDMYFFPASTAEASNQLEMRANLGLIVLEAATQYAHDAKHYIQLGLEVRDALGDAPLVDFHFAPHAPYTVSNDTFEQVATLAEQIDIGIHTHLHETRDEITQSETTYGLRPLSRLANLGILGPNVTMAHCVHLDETERALMTEYHCSVVHCPSSNLKLASGIAPVTDYLNDGINVALGTDGAASNNRLDMFAEMRLSALLAKGASGDATAASAHQVLAMATINGANALDLGDKIGSIEVGKMADLTAVNMQDIALQPCFDPVSHLVYVAERQHVSHVWVNGDMKYHKPTESRGSYKNIELAELMDIIKKWQPKLSEFK